MRRILIPIIGLLCIMYACSNDLTTIGQEVIGNDSYIGEKSIPVTYTATIKADSFRTSSGLSSSYINQLVMGRYIDDYSGETVATPCFQISPQNGVPILPNNAVLDSVTFNFTYAGNMWGDTLRNNIKLQKYYLHQLKEIPKLDYDDNTFFYNTQTVEIDENPIATAIFYPLAENINKTYFKIDELIADDLFDRMMYREDHDNDIYNPEVVDNIPFYNFLHYFRGLAIIADENNNCMMTIHALSDDLYLEFHYSFGQGEYSLKFPLSHREFQYNRIVNEPTSTLISLKDSITNEVLFEDVQFALTQGMCGYMTKLTLPRAPGLDPYTTIIKAQLEIKPVFMNNNPIAYPKVITVWATNDINELKGFLYNDLNNANSYIKGILDEDATNTDNTRYIFDMTEYYQDISTTPPTTEKQQILLSVPEDGFSNTGVSFDQMVVREVPILRVYYAKYK